MDALTSARIRGVTLIDGALLLLLAALTALAILMGGGASILLLAGTFVFAVFLRAPILGLYITTVMLLLSGSATVVGTIQLQVPLTAAKVCGVATFLAWVCRSVARKEPVRASGAFGVLCLFLIWASLGVVLGADWEVQWPEWIRLATLVLYFFLAINLLNTPTRVRTFIYIILLCGLCMSFFAVLQYFLTKVNLIVSASVADIAAGNEGAYIDYESLTGGPAVRVTGGAGHSNWLAMVILVIMPLNAYWYTASRRWPGRMLALITVFMELAALVLTFTRTGFLVGVILVVTLIGRHLLRFTPHRAIALITALVVGWFLLPSAYKERVFTPTLYTSSESVQSRLQLQDAAWNIMMEHPLWGAGLGGFGPNLLKENTPISRTMAWFVEKHDWPPQFIGTHNMYLQLGCETGVVGLALLLLFLGMVFWDLHRTYQGFRHSGDTDSATLVSCIEVSFMSFLICSIFLHALQQKIWWMVAALAAVAPLYELSLSKKPKDGGEVVDSSTPPLDEVKVDS